MTLCELQIKNNYTTDKGTTHSYLEVYDRLFKPFQDKEINLLEVGIATGGSLKLWEDYFSKAHIWGIDIIDEVKYKYGKRVYTSIYKLEEVEFSLYLDIAIDDGSHFVKDQMKFINSFWPAIRKGGLLIIEDVHDLETNLPVFQWSGINFEVLDMRDKGPHDNVLLIFRK